VIRLALLSIRRPAVALTVAAIVALALSLAGLGVADSVSPSITTVPGTQSSHAQHLSESEFGPSVLVPVLLEGPAQSLDRQGPALVRELAERPDTRVLSAWDGGAVGTELRPRPTAATIVAAVATTEEEMVRTTQAQIDDTVARTITEPVRASITGQPTIDRALKDTAIDATRVGIALALPLIFVVLLLLLRAPVAAAGLTLLGAATAFSSLGLVGLLGKTLDVDAVAITLGAMTGLALGVGYGLLLFRRWRDELGPRGDHVAAAQAAVTAVGTAGRGILVGGTVVVVSLILASLIGPTDILVSLGIGATLCAALAIGGAVVVVPAALTVLGPRALAFGFAAPAFAVRAWDRLVSRGGWVVAHAVPVGAVATALLAALAIPVLSLRTGPPSVQWLPADDAARVSYERVAAVMGPGWPTPFNIVVASDDKPITDAKLLQKLDRYQAQIAKDPRVASVVGPGTFAATSRELGVLPKELRNSTKLLKSGKRDLGRLERGLGQAGAGAVALRSGLVDAASGAEQLEQGSGSAEAGSARLRQGLSAARSGAARISSGLDQALGGARRLSAGAAAALSGSKQITGGIGKAAEPVKAGAPIVARMAGDVSASTDAVKGATASAEQVAAQLAEAQERLNALPPSEARAAALGAVDSAQRAASGLQTSLGETGNKLAGASAVAGAFATQVQELSDGLSQLLAGSTQLQAGIGQLKDGNSDLESGIGRLAGGGSDLTEGVTQLRDGAAQLETGLGRLTSGAGQLAGGLSAGSAPTGRLASGLGQLESGVAQFRTDLPSPKDLERLQRSSPGLFDSGYFVLAAISGARPADRNQASFAVNLERGGSAGQITVVAKQPIESPSTQELGADLKASATDFAAATGTEAAVGGPAGSLADFRSETASRIWPVIGGLALAAVLLLVVLLRSVVLPVVAVAFDLLTAAATFGVLALLFDGSAPLGGPGYLDPMSVIGIFAFVFGITMVYEVQLLQRTREALVGGADPPAALRTGLRATAGASTGAAIAMVAAAIPFALTELITVRQFAIGAAVAVVLDALIVRPVLLPAAVQVLGRFGWWPTGPRPVPAVGAPTAAAHGRGA
jgi:X-X-X-Leu-X-X-Gly heptad repeat protein